MDFRQYIHSKTIVGLSPMDGYTDEPLRLVQAELCRPDVMVTEFVSAEGLSRGGVKLYDTLLFSQAERPIVGQIFGKDPESFYKTAIVLCHLGFDGVDINMGCPAHTVTQHGSGAALIGKPDVAREIILAAKKGIDDWFNGRVTVDDLGLNQKTLAIIKRNLAYSGHEPKIPEFIPTLSVKTRLGILDKQVETWFSHLVQLPLDYITLHGRTLKQGYSGLADWEEIAKAAKIAKAANILIWGNGDICSRQDALAAAKKYGTDGILIGRAALGNPWVFENRIPTVEEKYQAMVRHSFIFKQVFPHRLFDVLRKHFLLYASGHPRAKLLRSQLVRLNSLEELYSLEGEFLSC